jgi:hypothetical protein
MSDRDNGKFTFLRRDSGEETEHFQHGSPDDSSGSATNVQKKSRSLKADKEKNARDELTCAFDELREILQAFSKEYPANRVQMIKLAVHHLKIAHELINKGLSDCQSVIGNLSQTTMPGIWPEGDCRTANFGEYHPEAQTCTYEHFNQGG